jgi:CDP-6-deoxy-D-xylo-4-hexulose-3-dehydrase
MKVPLASSGLRPSDLQAAIETLESGSLTMGSRVKLFEKKMADYLGVKYFIMMNSGSSANLAIFEALLRPSKDEPRLKKGDGILVPSIAWPTTIWPIVQLGLVPIFVDVNQSTIGIDLHCAQEVIDKSKSRISGIFPIHPLGLSLDEDRLFRFCQENDLIYLADVCESLGSFRNGIHAGVSALASSFSFYFSHHITTMEGGGVATNDLNLADDLRSVRSHGWSRDRDDVKEWSEDVSLIDSKFKFVTTGFNIRPMEIQASIGLNQIDSLEEFIEKRRRTALKVWTALEGKGLAVIDGGELSKSQSDAHSWMLIPIRVLGNHATSRKKIITDALEEFEIETRPVLTGNFLAQPAMKRIGEGYPSPSDFPVATEISDSCFLVGAHHDLTNDQIQYMIDCLIKADESAP